MSNLFKSLFDQVTDGNYLMTILIVVAVSLGLGLILGILYRFIKSRGRMTKGMALTLVILPSVVALLVAILNIRAVELSIIGIETGLVLAGIFAITRFRSEPLNAEDLTYVVIAFFIGMANGVGYVGYAVLGSIAAIAVIILFYILHLGEYGKRVKRLRFIVPEDLNYEEAFQEVFKKYLRYATLEKVKTMDFGQVFELTYVIKLRRKVTSKDFMDELRVKNANLEIMLTSMQK
jgi:hypothetical protein